MLDQRSLRILAVADTSAADLIMLCSHGYTGMTRRIMGSVAQKLARETPCPCLHGARMDRCQVNYPRYELTRPLRALVPLDGTAQAKTALEPAAYAIAALGWHRSGSAASHASRPTSER